MPPRRRPDADLDFRPRPVRQRSQEQQEARRQVAHAANRGHADLLQLQVLDQMREDIVMREEALLGPDPNGTPPIDLPRPTRQERRRHAALNATHCSFYSSADDHDFLNSIHEHYLGTRSEICCHCQAFMWPAEKTAGGTGFSICCQKGKINLPSMPPAPNIIFDLHRKPDFHSNIRQYNSVMQMASSTANVHQFNSGVSQFRVNGEVRHRMGPLVPAPGAPPQFASIYILDSDQALRQRMGIMANLNPIYLEQIQTMLHEHNPHVQLIKAAGEYDAAARRNNLQIPDVIIDLNVRGGVDLRRYNAPTAAGEIAAFIPNTEQPVHNYRNIEIRLREGGVQYISDLNPHYHPLHFPLLFPKGGLGWHPDIPHAGPNAAGGNVTCREWAAYHLQQRWNSSNLFLISGKLYQEFVVDTYCQTEAQRLKWIRHHQSDIRADLYQEVAAAAQQGQTTCQNIGKKRIVLPSSFIGGPRHMKGLYQDAMATVRKLGKPDLFITFTCNPKWREVSEALLPGQQPNDRPELLARVFKMKLNELLNDIIKKHVLGRPVGHIHVIEFQKRGLPHAHILIILAPEDKLRSADEYDKVICAELPDPINEPDFFQLISRTMLHGPCGPLFPNCPCMRGPDGKPSQECAKRFPKAFCNATKETDGYPEYRRRDDGRKVEVTKDGITVHLDNRHVVPYNRAFSKKYQAHINVEYCASIKSIKYLHKYVYKGHDAAEVTATVIPLPDQPGQPIIIDELREYTDGRYVGASEACWRLFEFPLHEEGPKVERLPVHLPNHQAVEFDEAADLMAVVGRGPPITKLTAWFDLNQRDPTAQCHTYDDIPTHYTWNKDHWQPRKGNGPMRLNTPPIGRMYFVHRNQGEKFYLRVLLTHVSGATSYESLRTVDGQVCATFQEAARLRGLLQDDAECNDCLTEARMAGMPAQLRNLFATFLAYGCCSDPFSTWTNHKHWMVEDFVYNAERLPGAILPLSDQLMGELELSALRHLDDLLKLQNKKLADFPDLPQPPAVDRPDVLVAERAKYNENTLQAQVDADVPKLNVGQRQVYDQVMMAVNQQETKSFFIDSPGGCGKTFTLNLLLAATRAQGFVAVAVASSGIAALLMDGGTTAHSRFKIPIDVTADSVCDIKRQSDSAKLLREARLIVWDEAPMTHKHCYGAMDRALRDLTKVNLPFGGKVVVMAGDFRQVLPVVPRGTRASIVQASIKKHELWNHVTMLRLTENMRVQLLLRQLGPEHAARQQQWAEYLLAVGEGRHGAPGEEMRVPDGILVPGEDPMHLVRDIYGDLAADPEARTPAALIGRCILTPKNDDVQQINDAVTKLMPGDERVCYSADYAEEEDEALYPREFLNSLDPQGLPPHELRLKVGSPIILLRNLNFSLGLANGTRLIVKDIKSKVLLATIQTGPHKGTDVLIPRIPLSPSETSQLPIKFTRLQFPVKVSFAMTINKAQGQTFQKVGLYLPRSCFSHGQLYVGMSRVGQQDGVRVMVLSGSRTGKLGIYTDNVVYNEIFE